MKKIRRMMKIRLIPVMLIVAILILNISHIFYATEASPNNTETIALAVNSEKSGSVSANGDDTIIVVSLGDSYSSGEGIEPFYGQYDANGMARPRSEKIKDERWLAHRSTLSWPGLLKFSGMSETETLKDFNVEEVNSTRFKWYFKAASGAETKNFSGFGDDSGRGGEQKKTVLRVDLTTLLAQENRFLVNDDSAYTTTYLPKQLDVFSEIDGTVDYVTMSIGGNDAGFTDIIKTAATRSSYLGTYFGVTKLRDQLNELWGRIDQITHNLEVAYYDTSVAAGKQAHIIVAGYPMLLDANGRGFVISKDEASAINSKVSSFNVEIKRVVDKLYQNGMDISFVPVVKEFEGHEAWSVDAKGNSVEWINPIMSLQSEDLFIIPPSSAYSIHPNAKGAQAYADCVNKKIQEIESWGTISGKVCKNSDHSALIPKATVLISYESDDSNGSTLFRRTTTDNDGNYYLSMPQGNYSIKISADGYEDFEANITIDEKESVVLDAFLVEQGSNAVIDSGKCGDDAFWTLYENGELLISGSGDMYNYNSDTSSSPIPWVDYRDKVESVVFKGSITSIGAYAFDNCFVLSNITIPNSVISIGKSAFANCLHLANITIPNSVTSIGDRGFAGCSSLTNLTIPNSVTSIGNGAIYGNSSLESINVASDNRFYASIDGLLYNIDKTKLIACPSGKSGDVVLPNSVTIIGNNSFSSCKKVTSIMIPSSVTSIENYAFYTCQSLTNIEIPNSVTSIGNGAFSDCNALTSVVIPYFVTSIGTRQFDGCRKLTSITIPDSVTSVGDEAFLRCDKLADVYYIGSEEKWMQMSMGKYNYCLTNAAIHYNYS